MPGKLLLILDRLTGRKKEYQSVQQSAGAANAGDIPALGADGRLDPSMIPGETIETSIVASENLSGPCLVNIWNDAGTRKARKADATAAGKEADGWIEQGISALAGANVTVNFGAGPFGGFASLTIGAAVFLSKATPGGLAQDVSGYVAGNVVQRIGRAISATEITFEPDDGVILA